MAISSTSLTLLEDTQNMLRSIGMSSTIGFSKITSANNVSWVLTISTPGIKEREKDLSGMCNARKYAVLRNATVSTANGSHTGVRRVLFPATVAERIMAWIPQPKLKAAIASGDDERIERTRKCLRLADAIKRGKECGIVTEDVAISLITYLREERFSHAVPAILKSYCMDLMSRLTASSATELPEASAKLKLSDKEYDELAAAVDALTSPALRKNNQVAKAIHDAAKRVTKKIATKNKTATLSDLLILHGLSEDTKDKLLFSHIVFSDHIYQQWESMAIGGFTWAAVEEVIKTGIKETGYDLTVPGYETFMGADGVIRSNTVNVHVPASDAAVKEAMEQLMPSQQPFSDRVTGKLVPLPKQEQVLGLYAAATAPATTPVHFNSKEEAIAAIRQGKVKLSDDIDYPGMDQDVGFVRS